VAGGREPVVGVGDEQLALVLGEHEHAELCAPNMTDTPNMPRRRAM